MVSTRRSRSAGGESEQAAPLNSSQEDVSSKHRVLQPITEEAEPNQQQQPAATPRGRSSRRAASQQQQLQEQQPTQEQQPQQQDQEPAQQQQQQQQHGGGASISDDEDDDDDAGLDFDGDSVLQNLAAAIRSGFQSQRPQQPQPQQPRTGLQAAAAAAAAAKKSSSSGARELDDAALQQLRWRPHTGLQMPARAAAAVAITKPRQKKRQQDDAEQPVGAAAAATSPQQPDPATAAAASKQPGLAKALHAPTLDAAARGKEAKKSAPDTAGSKWFDLPAPKITEDLKRDLRLLRLRGAYDPKRFYKSFDNTKFPKYFAVGTVVDDPLEQNNLSKGQRRATLTEQLLVDTELTTTRKRRFNKLQDDAKKWAKVKKRKTSQQRKNPSKHRPKH